MNDTYRYSVYGEIMAGEETGQPFRFTGRRYDAETGLYYYRGRYYAPINISLGPLSADRSHGQENIPARDVIRAWGSAPGVATAIT